MARMIVDSRESQSGLAKLLSKNGVEVVVEQLECADIVVADGLAVERKTGSDFIISILDRRLFSQVAVMKKTYARVVIIIEGSMYGTRSAIAPEALNGALSWLTVIENVSVVPSTDTAHTANLLMTMQRHALEGLGYNIALRSGMPKDRLAQAQYLVEGLPGIGPSTAQKLLAHFDTAKAVFQATDQELKAVPGIGAKTIATVREVLEYRTQSTQSK